MATVSPDVTYPDDFTISVLWEEMATGDTINPFRIPAAFGALASMTAFGTFNGGTSVGATATDDRAGSSGFDAVETPLGAAIEFTAAGRAEMSIGALYIKPTIASGSSDDVDVYMTFRGDKPHGRG